MREFDLLRDISRQNARLPGFVAIPPGDDMARLALAQRDLLVAVDQVVEGRHVVLDEDPALVARKAVARNLSDVAAMAARPLATLAAVVLPQRYGEDRARVLIEALRSTAEIFGAPLVGGDLSMHSDASAPLVCSVTVLAEPAWPGARVVTRGGARTGDGIYVTGRLGGSVDEFGRGRHLTFDPRVNEAIELLETLGDRLHAMIDISDGLGRDAAHLTENDDTIALELDASRIPLNDGCSITRGLGDGEDYELLFVAAGDVPARVRKTPVTRVGTVRPRGADEPSVVLRDGSATHDVTRAGWEHVG